MARLTIASILIVAIVAQSCNKTEVTPAAVASTDLQHLIDKKWLIINETSKDSAGNIYDNYWATYPSYLKDDITTWSSDNKYVISDNEDKRPNSSAENIGSGTWASNGNIITMTPDGQQSHEMKILELSAGVLKLEFYNKAIGTTVWTEFKIVE